MFRLGGGRSYNRPRRISCKHREQFIIIILMMVHPGVLRLSKFYDFPSRITRNLRVLGERHHEKNDDGDWKRSPPAGKECNNQLEGTLQFARWFCGAVESFSMIDRLIKEKIINRGI